MERTLVIIKPDGVRRHLIGRIIQRFEGKGFSNHRNEICYYDRRISKRALPTFIWT